MKNMSKLKKIIMTLTVLTILIVVAVTGVLLHQNNQSPEALKVVKISEENFSHGMTNFNLKNYQIAYSFFKSVVKDDRKSHGKAVDKMKQCIELGNKDAIEKAQISASKGKSTDYYTAITFIERALEIDKNNQELINLKEKYNKAKADVDAKSQEALRIATEEYVYNSNGMLSPAQEEAKKKGVTIGMTAQQCLDSNWGKPDQVNKTTTAYGTNEQWVYGYNSSKMSFLYFENGILTSIQN